MVGYEKTNSYHPDVDQGYTVAHTAPPGDYYESAQDVFGTEEGAQVSYEHVNIWGFLN